MTYIPKEDIREILQSPKFPYRIFVVDTETTGFKGTMQHHRLNQILQVCCVDLLTGECLNELCKPPEVDFIPEFSTLCHRITMKDVENCPAPAVIMDQLIDFARTRQGDKQILMVAHNAPFDREMILKSIKGKALGYEAQYLKWQWMDTLEEIKTHFPWLRKKYWPSQNPHKLETLMGEFYPDIPIGEAHNAKADVRNLSMILCEHLWKYLFVPSGDEDARDHELRFSRFPPSYHPTTLSVKDVSGFGPVRAYFLHQVVMEYYNKIPELRPYKVPNTALFKVGHIYLYALYKWQLGDQQGECVYKGICDEVRLLLRREPLNIVNDSTVLEMCKLVSGVWSTNDFAFHMMTTQGDKDFFSSSKGSADNWVTKFLKPETSKWNSSSKVIMDEYSALMLKEKFNIGGIHDLYMEYCFTKPNMRPQFCKEVQAYFPPEVMINPDTLQEIFQRSYLT